VRRVSHSARHGNRSVAVDAEDGDCMRLGAVPSILREKDAAPDW